ncbi:MAG: DUF3073 family protein [Kutzneria sp.]|nr:DUF3073 family protein [Kutzneria sp.]
MGRGRAKAMQAKIARELKYSSPPLDVEALRLELTDGESEAGESIGRGAGNLRDQGNRAS